jgi:hypothetical protein
MKKSSEKAGDSAKLQIPVSRELADELARWAQKMQLTQANMCKALLAFAMDDLHNIGEWLKIRAIGKRPKWMKASWLQNSDNAGPRLQVLIPVELVSQIEELSNRLNQSSVKLAALLLDFSLADEKWAMRFLTTRAGHAFMALLGKKPQSFESAEIENGESN